MFNKIKRTLTVALSCIAVAATMAGIGLFNVTLTKAEVSEAQTMLTSGNLAVTKASVKYKLSEEDQTAGIKFLVEMDKSVYESSVDVENSNVKIGVLIIPEYVMQHNSETELTLGTTWVNNAVLYDGAAETPVNAFAVSETDDTKVEAVAYLYGQPETHYDKTLKVRAYLSTSESDVAYSSVLSPVLSEVAYEARKALSESAQDYEVKYAELSKYVKPKAIKSIDDFVAIYADEESLSREYKLETDIAFTSTSLDNLITTAGGINNIYNAVFTGTLDGNGHKITGNGSRLFLSVAGTIKNLTVIGDYSCWGGALGETLTASGVVDNVVAGVSVSETRAWYVEGSTWHARNSGGMFNYISGTVTNSTVHVTVPSDVKVITTPGDNKCYALADMSAIGQVSGSATVTNCQAFLTNNATSETIHSVFQMANEPEVVSTKIELSTGGTHQLPAATAYVSSNNDIATVSESGLITAVSGGVATVTATVGGLEIPFTVSIWNEIATLDDLVGVYASTATLAGSYKLTADISLSSSLNSLIATAGGINNIYNAVFTGTLDGNGHKITGNGDDARLFLSVAGTIKNLTVSGSYGAWGGALGEILAAGGVVDNVKIYATLRETRAFNNNSNWYARSLGGMFNFISGTVTNSTVHVTVPSNITLVDGYPLTNMSAIGQVSGSATVTNCQAFLTNAINGTIWLANGVQGAPAVVSAKVELDVNGTYQLPSATAYVSSNSDIATVSESGLITAVTSGVATVTATINGVEIPFTVIVWKEISTAAEFAAIYNDEASLGGYYKLANDIEFEDQYLSNLVSVTDSNFNSAVFTGVLDGNGKHVFGSKNTARLFARLSGTIKNLTVSGSYGVWGGAIADYLEKGGYIYNVTVNATILDTRFHDNNNAWGTRFASAMVNFIRGGIINNCVANVTIPENITVTGGHALTSVAAIGTVAADAGAAYSVNACITGCTATLVNDKSADSIVLVGGIQNPVTVAPQSVTENE